MGTIGRRGLLVAGVAAAAAACGRARPTAAPPPVTEFIVTAAGRQPADPPSGLTPAQALSARTAAAAAWWNPVLQAFNRTHASLRATFGPMAVSTKTTSVTGRFAGNRAVSVLAGYPPWFGFGPSVDLSAAIRHANLDVAALLPAPFAAARDPSGAVGGIPIDFDLLAMRYSAAGLQKAHLAPPPGTGWTLRQFSAAVAALSKTGSPATVFGQGLATQFNSGGVTAWFGFAEGYGGTVFGTRVVLASGAVYEGLRDYAGILRITSAGLLPQISATAALGFQEATTTRAAKPWAAEGLARFPRLPVTVAPADVLVARVPTFAPRPAAGATFCVWLASPPGQAALTGLGYPAMRLGAADAPNSATAKLGVRPTDLRFRPGGIFGIVRSTGYNFDSRIIAALLQPEPARLARLRSLEQALSGILDGSLTRAKAAAQLNRDGVMP